MITDILRGEGLAVHVGAHIESADSSVWGLHRSPA